MGLFRSIANDGSALIALQRSVLAPQAYVANVADTNLSGQLSVAYKVAEKVDSYVTYATGCSNRLDSI